jgi:hypothetical protein
LHVLDTIYYAPALPGIDGPNQLERCEASVRAYIATGDVLQGINFQPSGNNAFQVLSSTDLIARLADAGAGGHCSGVDRCRRDPQCTARFDPAYGHAGRHMTAAAGRELHRNHVSLIGNLDRLRSIVDTLDDATAQNGAAPIAEANKVVREQVVAHERDDEGNVYPQLVGILKESHSFSAMSRAHREILHLARLLARGGPLTVASSRTSLHDRCS